ncbi:SIS domain-containing protein [Peribacillus sp. SCS-26]|uniref:SIS domain-containing protein n=1 Tax=Paraperibacillus marinus TaxID=3115295 RepID=UPI003905E705
MNTHTWNEITSQHEAMQKTSQWMKNKEFKKESSDTVYLFTGCGTSFYLAHSAARYFQRTTGRMAAAVPASEIFMDRESIFSKGRKYVMIVISRSGTTSEAVKALQSIKGGENIQTLAVTCSPDGKTAELADDVILLDFIQEKSVVMTQSFTCMLYALQLYAAAIAGDEAVKEALAGAPELAKRQLAGKDIMEPIAEDKRFQQFIFLGPGIFHGIVKEATLKMKEMTQVACESYSSLEFRHGPISIVDEKTAVILLSSDLSKEYDQALIQDIQNKKGTVIVFGCSGPALKGDISIDFPSGVTVDEAMTACMPQLQLLAYYKALSLGLNPDQPRNLTQVVELSI